MTGNDLIKFFSKLKFNKEEEKIETFAYAKLEDDTVIQSDDFIVGNPIVKVLEDGTTEPLTDGEYIIKVEGEEGELLKKVIIVEGLIDSIEDVVEVEPEPEPETEMEEELEKLDGAPVDKFTKVSIKNIESKQDKFLSKLYR